VSARIVGSKGDSGWHPLIGNHDTFERGQVRGGLCVQALAV